MKKQHEFVGMMKPLVSIIIPCFNVEDHLETAVQCALAQTYENKEIICIDNDSSDDTWERLNKLKDRFPELIISQEFRKGAPAARNRGLAMAKGEWIQFLDADDRLSPDKIAHQVSLLKEDQPIAFIAAAALKGDPISDNWVTYVPLDRPWKGVLTNQLGNTCANLFKRSLLNEVGGWNESLKSSQEYDLMFRMLQKDNRIMLDMVAENTLITSARSGSISAGDIEGNKHRFLALNARICAYLKKEAPEEYASLEQPYFEEMYQRIRLNTIKGYPDSAKFHREILPAGFRPKARTYDAWWFRILENSLGFSLADKVERWKINIKT